MSYLILGGCGFIGRNLVSHLLDNELAETIVVIDKIPPAMAWLSAKHKTAFEDSKVTFKSINLLSRMNIDKIKELGVTFDYCVNLAAETKLGLSKEIYEERVTKLAQNCALFAKDQQVKLYVELSSAQVYGSSGKTSKEDSKTNPKYDFESCKLKAEEEVAKVAGLNHVILRAGMVYGPGDRLGYITSQLVIASIYSHLGETMKLIWNKNMYVNTVHVEDLCHAVTHLIKDGIPGETYNVVDMGDTILDGICVHVGNIFDIKYEYISSFTSMLASISLKDVAEDVNEKHLSPWSEMCSKAGISNTPLSPFIYSSQLETLNIRACNHKLLATGFQFKRPGVTEENIRDVLEDCVKIGIFPKTNVK
ncbi:dTDP-D-glucose 4,6-dehydratase-like [Bolinopsis microptera]|uniref:dTDP-D-glucose 4,6-dehydratase-like n=1 Tax=Bolinopsis microptera TaxID=2820187 RepID=UPI00307AC434